MLIIIQILKLSTYAFIMLSQTKDYTWDKDLKN